MTKKTFLATFASLTACSVLLLTPISAHAEDTDFVPVRLGEPDSWPTWRGPVGNGVSGTTELPEVWSRDLGVKWSAELDGSGDSTPAIDAGQLFLTAQRENGELLLQKFDAESGQLLKQVIVGQSETPRTAPKRKTQKFHRLHNMASPSPVLSGDQVVVHFGNGVLATYTRDLELLWERNLQEEYRAYSIWWGHANSPVVFEDSVISVCMQDSLDDLQDNPVESYLVAHHLKTGVLQWKSLRMTGAPAEQADAYTTPLLVTRNDRTIMLVMGGNQLDAYDPKTGKQLWYLPDLTGGRTVTGPVVGNDHVFVTRGMRGPLLAVKLADYQGKVSPDAVTWTVERSTPDTPSPVYWNGLLFTVTDDGIANCYDANTGELNWKERLGGNFKASPIAADDKVYFVNIDGVCHVVAASASFKKLSENNLNDTTLASPAIAAGRIYLRGNNQLVCVGI